MFATGELMTELEKGLLMIAVILTIPCVVLGYDSYKEHQRRKARKQEESDFIT